MPYREQIVILDSCIYRKMPLDFSGIDYVNLLDYIVASKGKLILSETVQSELSDYFSKDYMNLQIDKYSGLIDKLSKSPYLDKVIYPDISGQKEKAIVKYLSKLQTPNIRIGKIGILKSIDLSSKEIVDFLITDKRIEPSRDNLRDFLIWRSLVSDCSANSSNEYIFISNDKIYLTHSSFILFNQPNLKVYNSIPDFLYAYGFKVDFLISDLISKTISKSDIEDALTPYTHDFYETISDHHFHRHETLDEFTIGSIRVKSYYSYKDIQSGNLMFVAHMSVELYLVFVVDDYYYRENQWQKEFGRSYPWTKDEDGYAEFNDDIDVVFRGKLDESSKSILDYEFEEYFY